MGTLSQYIPFFVEAGFDDLGFLLSLDDKGWDEMIESIITIAANAGNSFPVGHRKQILWKLKDAKGKKYPEPKEESILQTKPEEPKAQDHDLESAKEPLKDKAFKKLREPELDLTGVHLTICFEGFFCTGKKWCFCAGFSLLALTLSLALYFAYSEYSSSTAASSGGWQFVQVLFILGFITASLGALATVCMFMRRGTGFAGDTGTAVPSFDCCNNNQGSAETSLASAGCCASFSDKCGFSFDDINCCAGGKDENQRTGCCKDGSCEFDAPDCCPDGEGPLSFCKCGDDENNSSSYGARFLVWLDEVWWNIKDTCRCHECAESPAFDCCRDRCTCCDSLPAPAPRENSEENTRFDVAER